MEPAEMCSPGDDDTRLSVPELCGDLKAALWAIDDPDNFDYEGGARSIEAFGAWLVAQGLDAAIIAASKRCDAMERAAQRTDFTAMGRVVLELAEAYDGDVCPVCLDAIEVPYVTDCGHAFCMTCARKAFKAPWRRWKPCPVCRTLEPAPPEDPSEAVRSAVYNARDSAVSHAYSAWLATTAKRYS